MVSGDQRGLAGASLDGAVDVFLARAKKREGQRQCASVGREGQRQCASVGSSIWSRSKAAVRATEARGVCVCIAHRRWVGLRFPSPAAMYRQETGSTSDKMSQRTATCWTGEDNGIRH